jgi:hypothetical protein
MSGSWEVVTQVCRDIKPAACLSRETSLLASELVKLDKSQVAVKIFNMKPQYLQEIRFDLEA